MPLLCCVVRLQAVLILAGAFTFVVFEPVANNNTMTATGGEPLPCTRDHACDHDSMVPCPAVLVATDIFLVGVLIREPLWRVPFARI